MRPFSWQCQNLCLLSLAFILDWRVVHVNHVFSIKVLLQTQVVFHVPAAIFAGVKSFACIYFYDEFKNKELVKPRMHAIFSRKCLLEKINAE